MYRGTMYADFQEKIFADITGKKSYTFQDGLPQTFLYSFHFREPADIFKHITPPSPERAVTISDLL